MKVVKERKQLKLSGRSGNGRECSIVLERTSDILKILLRETAVREEDRRIVVDRRPEEHAAVLRDDLVIVSWRTKGW